MKKVTIGTLIIVAGIFLFCINTGILPYALKPIIFSWQMLLIVIGLTLLFDQKQSNVTGGVVLILIGFAFLFSKILPSFIDPGMFWPIVLIGVGIIYLVMSKRRSLESNDMEGPDKKTDIGSIPFIGSRRNDRNFVIRDYIFSGSKEIISNNNFKGSEINAVFSGVEVDFSQCQLADELKYINIKVSSVFGGAIIYLPIDWNVQIRKAAIFGDFVDRRPPKTVESTNGKLVILDLSAVFGGGEIRYYE